MHLSHSAARYRWELSPSGGEDGVVTLWLGTPDEVHVHVDSFEVAQRLANAALSVAKAEYKRGREDLKTDIARLL